MTTRTGASASTSENRPPRFPLWLVASITLGGTLGMHIFVPALPVAAKDLDVSVGAMQMTVSLYLLGLAIGQLGYGALSDYFGRRPVLMVGLAIYTVSGLAAALAPNAFLLIVARLMQALGGCAGLVLGRAVIRDTAQPNDAARQMALMNLMVTLGPGLAPIIGGLLASTFGWRSILVFLTIFGVVCLLLSWRLLPETRVLVESRTARDLARDYSRLLRSPAFLGFSICGGCATTSTYGFVAAAPFIFINELHRPDYEVGIYLALVISGIWLGTMLAVRLVSRVPIARLLIYSSSTGLIAALAYLCVAMLPHQNVLLVMIPMFVFAVGVGVSAPVALTQSISVNPQLIGSASGLYGFVQMAVGALCTSLVGFGDSPVLASAVVLASASVIGQVALWIGLRHQRTGTV